MASVLIVEDEELLRRNLTLYLAQRGHTVAEADGVETAIEALEAFAAHFDVILLDINLPDGTGWDVLRYLRKRADETSGTPLCRQQPKVIVMTAVRPAQCRLDEFRPEAFLLKPFPMDALARLLDRAQARPPRAGNTGRDESARLSAGLPTPRSAPEVPAATSNRETAGTPPAGSTSAAEAWYRPAYENDVPREDAELDVEDAFFGDHDIEYWVHKDNRLVPATDDEVAEIQEWGRESSALARLDTWKHTQARSHSRFAWLLRGAKWVEQRLGLPRRPLDSGQEHEQEPNLRQRPSARPNDARRHDKHATQRAT